MVHEERFVNAIQAKIGKAIDTKDLEKELLALEGSLRQTENIKSRLESQMDALSFDDPHYERKYADLQRRYDEKYDIKGYYIEDVTFDAKKSFGSKEDGGFAHCLLPIGSLKYYKNYIYASVYDKDRYSNIILNNTNLKGIEPGYKPLIERKLGKYSEYIDLQKYIDGMKIVFLKKIKNNKFDIDYEINKSINKVTSSYDYRVNSPFVDGEYKLLKALFGKKNIKNTK
jgi:hypothetical protein